MAAPVFTNGSALKRNVRNTGGIMEREEQDKKARSYKSYNRSKSSMASRYFMMFFLILEESTQVTKSSMFLEVETRQHNIPSKQTEKAQ